jgi:glyoxylase-like metal-dependent hydrolase (beta-lactamase superfamily II)
MIMNNLLQQPALGKPGRSRLQAFVFVSSAHPLKGPQGATFSPTTATLICGETEAVLIDTLIATEDVDALADCIARHGQQLTSILITHGHPDHYFGMDRLLSRFPAARVMAAPGVVDHIRANRSKDLELFEKIMSVDIAKPTSLPEPLASDVIDLEGEQLRVVNVGQGDIAPSTVVWTPTLEMVVAGDVAYNSNHLMLGLSGPEEWKRWIESVNTLRALNPKTVIAGHKKPEVSDEAEAILDGTEAYIRDFAQVTASSTTAEEVVSRMRDKYPGYTNVTILVMSAEAFFKRPGT